ncbi:FtsK/SpoIIIE domain-containing protein [Cytobacillus gottheilii]|uniref:Cell division protein FtsK n=1 Tax=Cytobacillus gottheilii TaxID=859144 RepID=A0ABX8FAQ1_9BACI|nr:FtsK/SpoIIIE domain-containing protein [Cytobacillus gottheilii]QVY60908.1 cell division protein FtsK [Cytobacillus gottheilii]
MIFEILTSTLMGGLAGYSYLKKTGISNDADKIQRIFNNAGMTIREDGKVKTIRLQRKRRIDGGMEYVYQLPLGMSSEEVIAKKNVLEDGLNIKEKIFQLQFSDILNLKLDKTLHKQLKELLTSKKSKKEIDIEFDGMLRIRIFSEGLQSKYEWNESYLKENTWSVPVGKTRSSIVRHDFDEHKHLIVAGSTGFGKSVLLKLIVTTLICQQPENVHLHLIDLKGGSAFQRYKDLKQTKNFTREPAAAKGILKEIQSQMDITYKEIVDLGYEDIKESGIKDRHFIIIDEAADIADDSAAMEVVTDIARKGRGAGYYLVYGTQYPSSQSIPQQTKRNIPVRLCYVLDDATASNTALGQTGAESLPMIPGRGIYKNVKTQVVQTPFISNKEIQKQIEPYINIRPREEAPTIEKSETNRGNTFKLEEM